MANDGIRCSSFLSRDKAHLARDEAVAKTLTQRSHTKEVRRDFLERLGVEGCTDTHGRLPGLASLVETLKVATSNHPYIPSLSLSFIGQIL